MTPWALACQAPLSMGFPRQEQWSGFPFPSPRTLPYSGIKPASLASPEMANGFFTAGKLTNTLFAFSSFSPLAKSWLVIIIHMIMIQICWALGSTHSAFTNMISSQPPFKAHTIPHICSKNMDYLRGKWQGAQGNTISSASLLSSLIVPTLPLIMILFSFSCSLLVLFLLLYCLNLFFLFFASRLCL